MLLFFKLACSLNFISEGQIIIEIQFNFSYIFKILNKLTINYYVLLNIYYFIIKL